jgi:hypothetical protein
MVKSEDPVEEAMATGLVPLVPVSEKFADGVDDPIPILPLDPKLNISAPVEEATARAYGWVEVPRIARVAIGVVVPPIPTLPFWSTESIVAPVEDAITNGLVPAVPWRLKVTVDEVALTPETVPLSIKRPVPIVVAVNQRVTRSTVPPERIAPIPRVDVATHLVVVPVVWSTIPKVPVALAESRNHPERVRLVAVAAEVVRLVTVPFVAKSVLTVPTVVDELLKYAWPVVVRLVADALAKVVCAPTLRV